MAKVIIGIHGLGNKPAANLLQEWWWKSISEGLRNHTKSKHNNPIFKLVYWADVLYSHPTDANCTDPENQYYISEPYEPEILPTEIKDHSFRQKILDSISEDINKIFLNDDYSLNFSALNNLIIERYFSDLNAYYSDNIKNKPIKEILRNRLKSVLLEHQNDEILLIAHSMGSIIAFDVLSLFSAEVQVDTFITIGSPLGLPVVVSKIANELKLKNRDTNKLSAPASIKKHWFNFSDLEDRVALNYKLDDDISESSNGVKIIDFLVHNTYVSNGQYNPHKAYGYLRTNEVATKIHQFIYENPLLPFRRLWYYMRKNLFNSKIY